MDGPPPKRVLILQQKTNTSKTTKQRAKEKSTNQQNHKPSTVWPKHITNIKRAPMAITTEKQNSSSLRPTTAQLGQNM
jgi:hypothetical protein